MHLCACDGKACMRGHVNNVNDDYDKSATGGRVYYGVQIGRASCRERVSLAV